ncbi:MAG: hypothetical protein ACTSQG_09120 [Promethearchaeota archaeon]
MKFYIKVEFKNEWGTTATRDYVVETENIYFADELFENEELNQKLCEECKSMLNQYNRHVRYKIIDIKRVYDTIKIK